MWKVLVSVFVLFFVLFPLLVCSQKAQCDHGVRCQPGSKLQANPKHKPSSNGCGNPMISVSGQYDLTPCCDQHDICYDTCFSNKEKCDQEFEKCMTDFCKQQGNPDGCSQQAAMYVMGVSVFGCGSFQQSQRKACACVRNVDEL